MLETPSELVTIESSSLHTFFCQFCFVHFVWFYSVNEISGIVCFEVSAGLKSKEQQREMGAFSSFTQNFRDFARLELVESVLTSAS